MSDPSSPDQSFALPRSDRLAHSPVVRRAGQWWLVSDTGAILATDRVFTTALDRFAEALAAADQAVAALHEPPAALPAPPHVEHP